MSNDDTSTGHQPHTQRDGYVLPRGQSSVTPAAPTDQAAADLIRQKIDKIYASEPDALQEEKQAEVFTPRSKHQQFMHDLNNSGKNLAQIQTEWHQYYLSLNDKEKHEVWQEFYANNEAMHHAKPPLPAATPTATEALVANRNQLGAHQAVVSHHRADEKRSLTEAQKGAHHQTHRRRGKPTVKQHFHSLLFGLGIGTVTLLIFLFGFFNEVIIAPFIQPGRTVAATPLIVNADTVAATDEPQVVIPKINVQIPVNFNSTTTNEADIENDLESGIVHYPTTSLPGQNGNSAYFGHSSNNIFNKGKYKFAFVLLHELVPGDTFYITKDHKVYAYKVFSKTVVDPSEVGVLNPVEGHQATATLITCDPPGTSLRRLIVVGDQVSPDINANTNATTASLNVASATERLAGNGQTLWGRFVQSTGGKAVLIALGIGVIMLFFRLTAPKSAKPPKL